MVREDGQAALLPVVGAGGTPAHSRRRQTTAGALSGPRSHRVRLLVPAELPRTPGPGNVRLISPRRSTVMKHLSLCLIACAVCPAQIPPPVTVPEGIALEANIAYDRFPATRLDVMYPKAQSKERRPGVSMLRGGRCPPTPTSTSTQSF